MDPGEVSLSSVEVVLKGVNAYGKSGLNCNLRFTIGESDFYRDQSGGVSILRRRCGRGFWHK